MERWAFVLGFLCLAADAAAQGGRVSALLDLSTHFAPFWLFGALVVVLYGAFFARPDRRAPLIAIGVVGAVAAAVLIAPELARSIPRAAPGPRALRLIQVNAWDQTFAPEGTAAWIARERPDFVFVEEVEPRIAAALLRRGFVCTPGVGHVAIFSRAKPIGAPARLAPYEWRKMPPFARATFGAGAAHYTVVAAHLPQPIYRVAGAERRMLATFVSRYNDDHLILAGDFNLTPWSFALRSLDRSLALRRVDRAQVSWPARLDLGGFHVTTIPVLPIDHVYVGSAWRLVSLRRGPTLGSDHYPLEVVLAETRKLR